MDADEEYRFGLGFLFIYFWHINLCKLFNAREQLCYNLTHSWEDKGIHIFPKGICPKVKLIARLEFELAYYDSAVHRFNHYTTKYIEKKLDRKNATSYIEQILGAISHKTVVVRPPISHL